MQPAAIGLFPGMVPPSERTVKRLLTNTGATITNQTSLTTILNGGAQSNIWPAFQSAGDWVRVTAGGHFNMAASSTVTWAVLMGGTTVGTIGPNTASTGARGFWFDLWFKLDSATSVRPYGMAMARLASSTGYQNTVSATNDLFFGDGTPVTVSAGPQTFDLKASNQTSNAASTITCESCDVWHYPS